MTVYFITGIDTEIGKTYVTGLIGKYLKSAGKSVITQKLVQTGCLDFSEDIVTHRDIMQIDLSEFDKNGTTCPYVFKYPASPHLAANMENRVIETSVIDKATKTLESNFEIVLLEGVGGIHVPLRETYTSLDYLRERKFPVIIVSSPKLGSINHTLLTLEVCRQNKIPIKAVIYNHYPEEKKEICDDSKKVFEKFLAKIFPDQKKIIPLIEVPFFDRADNVDFSKILF